nr:MAG TPA: hypothetical protein [Caudoviricetes sp.]
MHGGGIDPIKLRQYILYWDKIDYPTNNLFFIPLTPDEQFLKDAGLLKRSQINIIINGSLTINPEIFINSQLATFNYNNKAKDEIWSIAQPTKEVILPRKDSFETRSIQADLFNCLPVPTANVNLEDVLNFKERRHNELKEFRWLLDSMYEEIINSSDKDLTKNRCIEKLQQKIIEINRVMAESKIKKCLRSMKARINVSDIIVAGAKIGFATMAGGAIGKAAEGALLGLATSSINISREISLIPKDIPENLKDYAYLFHAHKELI